MTILAMLLILMAGGILAWIAARFSDRAPRWICLAALAIDLLLALQLVMKPWSIRYSANHPGWLEQVDLAWIPAFGIRFHLALDGLSLLLLVLTFVLGIISVLASWTEIKSRVGFFHFNLMWVLAGVVAVFTAIDLFLFYFAWELMLVPMYLLIAIWGHERRIYAAIKFFLFTQLSGLLMLIAILALYFLHHAATGVYTFEYADLLGTPLAAGTARWLMLGFFVAFAVKLPMVPFHTWLPDAHTEAPTAGSVILAGLLLKTGAYGMIRFVIPLFPDAAAWFAPAAMTLAVIGILYGGILALAQTDLKRLVAYTSVAHLGFVLLGIFAWNEHALQGAVMQMISHGFSTGALFVLVGLLQERTHTREISRFGGLWTVAPRLSGAGMFFALASLGLPGLGNFIGEFMVLVGTFRVSILLTALATIGVLVATFYSLRIVQRVFHGPNTNNWKIPDLFAREKIAMALMIVPLIWLGFFPQQVFNLFNRTLGYLMQTVPGLGR